MSGCGNRPIGKACAILVAPPTGEKTAEKIDYNPEGGGKEDLPF